MSEDWTWPFAFKNDALPAANSLDGQVVSC